MNIKFLKKQHYKEDTATFILKFDGDDEIDAETLSVVLDNIIEMIKGITANIGPDAYAKLKIKSTNKGSFAVNLATIVGHVPSLLFGTANIEGGIVNLANICVNTFKGILEIKKHLQGKKPENIVKQGDKYIIKNKEGDNLIIDLQKSRADLFFQNAKFDNCTVNIFNKLDSDTQRTSLHLLQEDTKQLTIEKEEYGTMSTPAIYGDNTDIITIRETTTANVFIKKPDFRGNSKWELMFLGKLIKAEIKDLEWLKKVHAGEISGFGAKITVPVEVLIEYDVDNNNDPIPNTHRYSILKVTGNIISPPINMDLFN
jgi:hypothetical protein